MRRIKAVFQASAAVVVAGGLAIGLPAAARADSANAPSLVVSRLKVTSSSGQFVALYNTTEQTLDMSKYQLEYFNSYDLTKATSSRLISLSGLVPPHGYFMVNDDSLTLCYRQTVDSVSLGLSSTAGFIEVLAFDQAGAGASINLKLEDYVGWSKTAVAGAQTLPAVSGAFLDRQPKDGVGNPSITIPGAGNWQTVRPDPANACNLISGSGGSPVPTGLNQLLPPVEPAAAIEPDVNNPDSTANLTAVLPESDIGLMAPTITELLPNPDGNGNDASDEFIELYNANDKPFDLTGFSLQTGLTTSHSFAFPAGTSLSPHAFKAFYALTTGLSLSNNGGQAKLRDPFGNSISATAVYGSAKDGQAWALANGKWYWTTRPTPGLANVINRPPTGKKTTAANKASKAAAKNKTSTKGKTAKTAKTKTAAAAGQTDPAAADSTPVHAGVLALVGSLALLYGAYEYRADLANRIYQFKRYLSDRRANRA